MWRWTEEELREYQARRSSEVAASEMSRIASKQPRHASRQPRHASNAAGEGQGSQPCEMPRYEASRCPSEGVDMRVNKAKLKVGKSLQGMNRWEREYAAVLDALVAAGEAVSWRYEALKFRLADGVWYTPDFVVLMADGSLQVVEVKGFLRDDARVKFKVAAGQFPEYEWAMLRKVKGEWEPV